MEDRSAPLWLSVREYTSNLFRRKNYLIIANGYTEEEAMRIEKCLNKQKFTVVTKNVEVKEL